MNDSDDDNLIGFIAGTVEGLREQVGTMSGQMTTKEDLARLEGQIETMRDQMATKEDLARLEGRLSEKLNVSTTAIRGDIEQVHLRMDGIEHASTSRIEGRGRTEPTTQRSLSLGQRSPGSFALARANQRLKLIAR